MEFYVFKLTIIKSSRDYKKRALYDKSASYFIEMWVLNLVRMWIFNLTICQIWISQNYILKNESVLILFGCGRVKILASRFSCRICNLTWRRHLDKCFFFFQTLTLKVWLGHNQKEIARSPGYNKIARTFLQISVCDHFHASILKFTILKEAISIWLLRDSNTLSLCWLLKLRFSIFFIFWHSNFYSN